MICNTPIETPAQLWGYLQEEASWRASDCPFPIGADGIPTKAPEEEGSPEVMK